MVGLNKGMTINCARGTKETFGEFKSSAIGDPYQDAGQYIMRKPASLRALSEKKPWVQSGANKNGRAKFKYIPDGPPARPKAD